MEVKFKAAGYNRYLLLENGEEVGVVYKTVVGWNCNYRGERAGGSSRKAAVEYAMRATSTQ